MSYKALVIEDDQHIAEEVAAILETSLGHTFDLATDQETARKLIEAGGYDHVLLDLEIPIRQGRGFARVQNGINLLDQIRASPHMRHTPVIVMTCHGTDGPDLAVDVMRKGATNFVKKPFPKTGRTLDEAIKSALAPAHNAGGNGHAKPAGEAKPFTGGELAYFEHHVELCGVTIVEESNRGHGWEILQALGEIRNGKPVPRSGEQLIGLIDKRLGGNTIAKSVSALRRRIAAALLRECNIKVGKHDVICNKGHGYRLNPDRITVRRGQIEMSPRSNVPGHVPGDAAPGTGTSQGQGHAGDMLNKRQAWFITELEAGRSPQRADIEEEFGCSDKTAKRDLADLRDRGIIEFVPKPNPGHYRLKRPHAERLASLTAAAS